MKPDKIIDICDINRWKVKDGYAGVICECGKTLYVKNKPEKAGQWIAIECPCGSVIQTIYTH